MVASLRARCKSGLLRQLRVPSSENADFSSNDYLGISHGCRLAVQGGAERSASGATGSRLLSGHSRAAERLETIAAHFHQAEASLLFNSGYDANVGLFSCVPQKNDIIVYDSLIHASVHDGMRLGRACGSLFAFEHNSVSSLREKLISVVKDRHASGAPGFAVSSKDAQGIVVYVAVESVYSMDGDMCPLNAMLRVANDLSTEKVAIVLIVDEAHGAGITGQHGEGVAVAQEVASHPRLFARIVTYGKAFAAHGAVVLGSQTLREFLVNYARSFIYSTALPPHSIDVLMRSYAYMATPDADVARKNLISRRRLFRREASRKLPPGSLLEAGSQSPIQSVFVPGGNQKCVEVCEQLRKKCLDVYPIRSPTVPRGTERIRIIIHSHNTEAEITSLVRELANALRGRSDGQRLALL